MRRLLPSRRPSAPMVISSLALFVSLGGAGYAATGQNLILGQDNAAEHVTKVAAPVAGATLDLTNTSTATTATALRLTAAAGRPPLRTTSATRVANLNADLLDGLSSGSFLRSGMPLSVTQSASSPAAAIDGNNTGPGNGVRGRSAWSPGSGVYGEHTTGGFGVAGRTSGDAWQAPKVGVLGDSMSGGTGVWGKSDGGTGVWGDGGTATTAALVGRNTSGGPALELMTEGAPMLVGSSTKVDNLNVDKVDGASIVSGRRAGTTANAPILTVPGFGTFQIAKCTVGALQWRFVNGVTSTRIDMYDLATGDHFEGVADAGTSIYSLERSRHFHTIMLTRGSNATSNAQVAQVTLTASPTECQFAAMAVVQPG